MPGSPMPTENATGRKGWLGRVLVVDDIEEMRQTMRRMLRWAGADRVDLAADIDAARVALEMARTAHQPYDLLIVDQLMPGGTGLELVEEVVLRELIDRRWTAVFLLTGLDDAGLADQAKRVGVLQCLEKPISTDALISLGVRWLKMRARRTAKPAVLTEVCP